MRWIFPLLLASFALGCAVGPAGGVAWAVFGVASALLARARGAAAVGAMVAVAAFAVGGVHGDDVPWWNAPPAVHARRVTGSVARGCEAHGDGVRCVVEGTALGTVSLTAPAGRCDAAPGDVLSAVVTARPVIPWRNPPLEDPAMQSLRRGVAWRVRTAACEVEPGSGGAWARVRRSAWRARRAVDAGLRRTLGGADAARAGALLFGEEQGLDEAELDAFRETGLAHLLAVSGAHVSMVLAVLGAVAAWLGRRVPWLAARGLGVRAAKVLPLPAAGFFVLMTGASPASVRALVSGVVTAALALAGRRAHPASVLSVVVLAMVLADPAMLHDLGLQLSTVATAVLVLHAPDEAPERESSRVARARRALREALVATVRVGLAVAPLLALRFGRAPALGTLGNVVAAPFAEAVTLPLTLATAAAAHLAPALAVPLGWLDAHALRLLFAGAALLGRIPLAGIETAVPTFAQTVALVGAAVLVRSLRSAGGRALMAAAVVVCAVSELRVRSERDTHGGVRITALDVGQGDALVLDLPDGRTVLVDAGGAVHGEADPGRSIVVPWLRATRRSEVALAVLTHPHPDHGGGLAAVFDGITVHEFWETGQGEALHTAGFYRALREAAERRGVPRRTVPSLCGQHRFGAAMLTVLAPCAGLTANLSPNAASLVLRVDLGRASAMLPGDLEAAGEGDLVRRGLAPVTVLKLGHHGSRTSSTEPWLQALAPRVALVSSGHPSPFGHPHPSVLARLVALGIPLRRTDRDGQVSVWLGPDGRFD